MTQAVILAAGRGSRMKALTQNQPKCMITLAGKSLIDWQIDALIKAGIKDIFLVVGYQSKILESKGYRCFINENWDQTNMVESLFCAKEILSQDETIVSYADIVYSTDIIKDLLQSSNDISITYDILWKELWHDRFSNPLMDVESFRIHESKVVEIGRPPKSLNEIQGQYMGLMKFTTKGWETIYKHISLLSTTRRKNMDMTTMLQNVVDLGIAIHGVPIEGKWCEADSPNDIELYNKKLQALESWSHDWRS